MRLTSAKFERYQELAEQIKKLEKEREEIKAAILENGEGEVAGWMIQITEITREQLRGLEHVALVYPKEVLREHNLIQTISYKRVKVSRE